MHFRLSEKADKKSLSHELDVILTWPVGCIIWCSSAAKNSNNVTRSLCFYLR